MTFSDAYTLKDIESLMDKLRFLRYVVLELSKFLLNETYYCKLQSYFEKENIELLFIDISSFVLNVKTTDSLIEL